MREGLRERTPWAGWGGWAPAVMPGMTGGSGGMSRRAAMLCSGAGAGAVACRRCFASALQVLANLDNSGNLDRYRLAGSPFRQQCSEIYSTRAVLTAGHKRCCAT